MKNKTLRNRDKLALTILTKGNRKALEYFLETLLQTEFGERKKLEEIQEEKLTKLFERSEVEVPYYSDVFKELKYSLGSKAPNEVLEDLPVLSKKIIKTQKSRMWSTTAKNFSASTTGGTTGTPLVVRKNVESNRIAEAALWRARMSWGIMPSNKLVFLRSVSTRSILGRLRMFLSNKRICEAFPVTQAEKTFIANLFQSFRPKGIEGYSTGLLNTIQEGQEESPVIIPVVITTGEMLYEHQKTKLERYYRGRVYSYYGSNEIGAIAFKCDQGNYHICEEHVIVETLDDSGKVVLDEPGRIVVTDMDNYVMPFIRYELGDIGIITKQRCECGRPSKVIKELHGRSQDFLPGKNEKRLQATQLAAYLKDLKRLGDIQFQYNDEGEIYVLYTSEEEAQTEFDFVKDYLMTKLGDVELSFVHVEEIEKSNRGKKLLIKKMASKRSN